MKRKSLVVIVLAMLLLFASSFSFTRKTQAFGCTQFCANAYNACMIECNGDANCQYQCWLEWECCKFMCDGTGTCW